MSETLFDKRINWLKKNFKGSLFSYNDDFQCLRRREGDSNILEVTSNRSVIEKAYTKGLLERPETGKYRFKESNVVEKN